MKDRFRFRAWHKPTKKMFEVFCFTDKEVFENTIDGVGARPTNPANIDDCVLIQCTGLKDKNAKLIYEGDILRRKNSAGRVVEWDDDELTFLFTTLDGEASMPLARYDIQKLELEIIGNIYENHKLLEEENA